GGIPFGYLDWFAVARVGEVKFGGDAVAAVEADPQQSVRAPGPQVGGQRRPGRRGPGGEAVEVRPCACAAGQQRGDRGPWMPAVSGEPRGAGGARGLAAAAAYLIAGGHRAAAGASGA